MKENFILIPEANFLSAVSKPELKSTYKLPIAFYKNLNTVGLFFFSEKLVTILFCDCHLQSIFILVHPYVVKINISEQSRKQTGKFEIIFVDENNEVANASANNAE